jgi:hypothetical protein
MFNKTCLVIYIGNGYSQNTPNYDGSYTYSVDMRDNQKNHERTILRQLKSQGYKIDTALVTNKHKYYSDFVDFYGAVPVYYNEFSSKDDKTLRKYFEYKVPERFGPGNFRSGGRFLNLTEPLPEYDLYVFVRADAHFKMNISSLNIDENKMNFLWAETDFRMYTDQREEFLEAYGTEFWFWNTYNRVAGNVFNVIPKKYINTFLSYYWLEHLSLHVMLKDLHPLITLENDVNIMMGLEKAYVTDQRFCENPVFTFNKRIDK